MTIARLTKHQLSFFPSDAAAACRSVAAAVASVSAGILLLDLVLFRDHLQPSYVHFFSSDLWPRLPLICLRSAIEEGQYRLLLMTGLVIGATLFKGRQLSPLTFVAIILAVQFVNVGSLVMADPAYALFRYLAVGSVWGWLYWRHGFLAAVLGHAGTHLLLDPLLMLGLR